VAGANVTEDVAHEAAARSEEGEEVPGRAMALDSATLKAKTLESIITDGAAAATDTVCRTSDMEAEVLSIECSSAEEVDYTPSAAGDSFEAHSPRSAVRILALHNLWMNVIKLQYHQ
jgi:hypothetical protein